MLEDVFKSTNGKTEIANVIAQTNEHLKHIPMKLQEEARKVGPEMNVSKTKFIT